MAGVRKHPQRSGKYQAWFTIRTGKTKYFTGTTSRKETLKLAKELEQEHLLVRLGKRPPTEASKHEARPFADVVEEYLSWGKTQGGRGGRAWGWDHAYKRERDLEQWPEELGISLLGELKGVQPKVEEVIRRMVGEGKAGKTIGNFLECLRSFCNWCMKRDYLEKNPLKNVEWKDTAIRNPRRAMPVQEVRRILDAAPDYRRLVYETSFLTGLRKRELKLLTPDDLDIQDCGIQLRAELTKNRRAGFKPISRRLMDELQGFAESGKAGELYRRFNNRKDSTAAVPENPLLFVPSHISRSFDEDRNTAKVPKKTKSGKIDFHSCRVAYVNFVIEDAANVKEAQEAARHSTPDLTLNVYGRSREDRQIELAEKVDRKITGDSFAPVLHKMAVGAESKSPKPFDIKQLRADRRWWRIGDSNP